MENQPYNMWDKLYRGSTKLSLKNAQILYDNGNDTTKLLLSNEYFPWYMLQADLENLGKLHGIPNCTEHEITYVKWIKYDRFRKVKPWEVEEKISDELFDELDKLADNQLILLNVLHTDRMDYEVLNGFYELKFKHRYEA